MPISDSLKKAQAKYRSRNKGKRDLTRVSVWIPLVNVPEMHAIAEEMRREYREGLTK